ncbi:hypothetical protein Pmani_029885 [Petrolisthes manimaculis]|uniref:ribonuclease P n=1 Tax=Petrolisthes manimaculis TaxID=1843537 RepID=A0AAE1NYP9_9EUCA|nr:hypothetical protein Pmani_029885 [Petrolisthes manimaculis]
MPHYHSNEFAPVFTKRKIIMASKKKFKVSSFCEDNEIMAVCLCQDGEVKMCQRDLTDSEWQHVMELTARTNPALNDRSCDALMMLQCLRRNSWPLGRSYMEYLKRQEREPNLATLSSYLQLCGLNVDKCGQETVLQLYHQLISRSKVLDARLTKSVVIGLSVTDEWKRAMGHLDTIRHFSFPCQASYNAVIAAAFRNGEYNLGWQHIDLMSGEDKEPDEGVLLEWMRQCRTASHQQETHDRVTTLFQTLAMHQIFPTIPVIQDIAQLYQDRLGWSAHFVKVPMSGRCPACKHKLIYNGVSPEEFQQLQVEFESRVLRRSDIFLNSTPAEWERFQEFVEANKPFLAVIDGLNIFYLRNSKSQMGEVIQEVMDRVGARQEGHILVLGRKHMRHSIPRSLLASKRVSLFTLNDLSRDDGFFLYAALQSGWGTKFITRDLLRDHLFKLELTSLRVTFRRWQRVHQIFPELTKTGRVKLMLPAKFGTIAQGGVEGWHIPYSDTSRRLPHEVPDTWLCLQPSSSSSHNGSSGGLTMTEPLVVTTTTNTNSKSYYNRTSTAGINNESNDRTDSIHRKFNPSIEPLSHKYNTPLTRDKQARPKSYKSKKKTKVLVNDVFELPKN